MQFSGALPRILWLLWHADPNMGPVYLAKFDITDRFYHLFLDPDDVTKLAAIMPCYDDEPQLVAIPLSLMMGWVSSPPTFCAASETAADLANATLFCHTVLPHRLKGITTAHDCWELPLSPLPGLLTASSLTTTESPHLMGPLALTSPLTVELGALAPCPCLSPRIMPLSSGMEVLLLMLTSLSMTSLEWRRAPIRDVRTSVVASCMRLTRCSHDQTM
jgi:hypothetical protein